MSLREILLWAEKLIQLVGSVKREQPQPHHRKSASRSFTCISWVLENTSPIVGAHGLIHSLSVLLPHVSKYPMRNKFPPPPKTHGSLKANALGATSTAILFSDSFADIIARLKDFDLARWLIDSDMEEASFSIALDSRVV